jgi:hypothetical protein
MAEKTEGKELPLNAGLNIRMERLLIVAVDKLRVAIQESIRSTAVVSRADVARLALRRLYLAYLSHLSDAPNPPADLIQQWEAQVAAMRAEGPVPDWLVPGSSLCLLHGGATEGPAPRARKKKGS